MWMLGHRALSCVFRLAIHKNNPITKGVQICRLAEAQKTLFGVLSFTDLAAPCGAEGETPFDALSLRESLLRINFSSLHIKNPPNAHKVHLSNFGDEGFSGYYFLGIDLETANEKRKQLLDYVK